MTKSNKQLAIVIAVLALVGLPAKGRAQSDLSSTPEAPPASEEHADAFFPEFPAEDHALSILERAARDILEEHAAEASTEAVPLAFLVKGVFERGRAWRSSSLPVCFIDPAPTLGITHAEFADLAGNVSDVAQEWNRIDGVAKLDFGAGTSVNRCTPGAYSVAVQFTLGPSQSRIGRDSYNVARAGLATMDLQLSRLRDAGKAASRQLILHEFGHALGLLHEFSHGDGRCWSKLDETKLYAFYEQEYGVSDRAMVRSKLATYDPAQMRATISTQIDDTSVMMYSFPACIYKDPSPPCRAGVNSQISDGDIETLQLAYRSPGASMMQLAALARNLPESDRRVVDAYIAMQMASDPVRGELIGAIDQVAIGAPPGEIADTIFEAAHSPPVQSLMVAGDL